MFRKVVLAAAASAAVLATGACMPMTTYSGFQAVEVNPADVKPGEDTKSTVMGKLGSPSVTSTFDPNLWFYMSQVTDRVAFYEPRVAKRDIVAISFDKSTEQVVSVNKYSLQDGKLFAYNDRETPTRGREMTILEQLLGNVGRGGMLPRDDEERVPGNRPGDR
ncbi:MAG: outer membrane protein assembly factor BamE [Caulobacter sp.]|jgi:outer membrane protein assembly factor BamE (lipoprotein component of BamABCDE complex)|nr:outer membrane protein assembly factor BamE [Caulobacter sp.]